MDVPGRSPKFTFESSVHSSHVLRSLEEQRQRDVLCDLTLLTAEGQSFRAHRSILVSCSEYFSQRIHSLSGQNTVITLPPEVTAAGFEPLLKFAYTSKLVFGKEDVLDIKTSVSVLGFKDLDGACFDFLLPKFFSSSTACIMRKTCCKKKCKNSSSRENFDSDAHFSHKEAKPVADSLTREEATPEISKSETDTFQSNERSPTPSAPVSKTDNTDRVIQGPKYRKFQLACNKETYKNNKQPVMKYCDSPCSSNSESGSCPLRMSGQVEDLFNSRTGNFHLVDVNKTDKTYGKKQEVEMQEISETTCNVKENAEGKSGGLTGLVFSDCTAEAQLVSESLAENRAAMNNFAQEGWVKAEERLFDIQEGNLQREMKNGDGKWDLEDEKTPNLSLDWLSVPFNFSSSVPSHVDGSTSGWTCPKSSECERASQYGFSSLYSGEDSDIEVAEGYCDAYEQERAKQVQLPYPVDQMLKMSKTHFQQILDKNTLSQEQVELVRDLRRRSKNRLAAQRCRKRKLDCIYNLQCEINKLKTEREKLIQEKSQLSDLRLQACHRVSTICQSVCVGSNLPPEQIQLLFKYASAERPLASSVPIIDSLLSSSHPSNTQLHPSDAQDDFDCPSTNSNDS
ncbi:unnamed protein product [Knipowitschia caucasica]